MQFTEDELVSTVSLLPIPPVVALLNANFSCEAWKEVERDAGRASEAGHGTIIAITFDFSETILRVDHWTRRNGIKEKT